MLWDKNKVTVIEGKGALDADANVVVDGDHLRGRRGDPRDRLGRARDPRRRVRRPGRRHLGRLVAALAAEVDRGRRRRRLRRRDRLRLHPLRHRGDAGRDAAPDPSRRGQGRRPRGRAGVQEAGDQRAHRQPDHRRRGRREVGEGEGRRRGDRGRVRLRSPAAAPPTPRASGSTRPGSRPATAARSRSTRTGAPRTRRCSRSATSSAARRSPTRPRRRAWSRPRRSPARHPSDRRRPGRRRDLLPSAGGERRAHRAGRPRTPARTSRPRG